MNESTIRQIFIKKKLGRAEVIKKIDIGWSSQVYSINNEYILKVCKSPDNEVNFAKEVFFYRLFKGKLPVPIPEILVYDTSKKLYDKNFMIYRMIQGDNLYSKWHLLGVTERKDIVRQFCEILKCISATPYRGFAKKFNIPVRLNWQEVILSRIQKSLVQIEEKRTLSGGFIKAVKKFVEENQATLFEQRLALVYWDAHFDNLLVQGTRIVGIIDFERIELASIDFNLDVIKRMQEYPTKYMAESWEKFAKKRDYALLLKWFREFYPELFAFNKLERRLAMYSVENILSTLLWWPKSVAVKKMLAKTIGK